MTTMVATPPAGQHASVISFDARVVELVAKLRNFIRKRVRNEVLTDDLTQETLLRVYRSRHRLRDEQRLEGWLLQIARTVIADHFRRTPLTEEMPAALAAEDAGESATMRTAISESARSFLEDLPAIYRDAVRLAEIDGLTHQEIAAALGLSLTAAKSRVRRGRAELKRRLQDCCHIDLDARGKVFDYQPRRAGCGCA